MTPQDEVRDLLNRGFVSTAFQPIVQLNTGRIMGFEALLRGPQSTALGNPGRIFGNSSPLSPGLIQDLDAACVAAALRAGRLLVPMGLLFINVHIQTLLHMRHLQNHYLRLMESSGIPPEAVVVEISERSRTETPRALARILRGLRKRGFRFALDDFGSAYSGLQHLLWFEPDYVKLDRAFAKCIHRSARKQALVAGAANVARKLGSKVIVEGVETSEELLTLMALDIPMAQGYHFGRPKAAVFWASHAHMANPFRPWFSSDDGRPSDSAPLVAGSTLVQEP